MGFFTDTLRGFGSSHGVDIPIARQGEEVRIVKDAGSRTWPNIDSALKGMGQVNHPADYTSFLNCYQGVPWIYSTDYLIASCVSAQPLRFFTVNADGDEEELSQGEVYDLFQNPNPFDSIRSLIELTALYTELTGNAYWEKAGMVGGLPVALFNIEPNFMFIEPDPVKKIKSYKYDRGDGTKVVIYQPEEIVHFKYANPCNPFYGLSQTKPLQNTIITELNRDTYTKSYLENEARPDLILTHEADITKGVRPLNKDDRDEIALKWRESFGGPRKTRLPVVMHSGMDVKLLTESIPDAAYSGLEKSLRERVMGASGVMPALISLFEYANYANTKEQLKIFFTVTLPPKFRMIEDMITRRILKPYDSSLRCRFDLRNIPALEEDSKEHTDRVIVEFSNGLVKRKEARKALGYEDDPEDPNADKYMVSSQLIPLEDAFATMPGEPAPVFGEVQAPGVTS